MAGLTHAEIMSALATMQHWGFESGELSRRFRFRDFTDARSILDYLKFAKSFIAQCEERYGESAVERLVDAAHALQPHGVHRAGVDARV